MNLQNILMAMGELDALISLYAEKVDPILDTCVDRDTFTQLSYLSNLIGRLSHELSDNITQLATDEINKQV